MKHIILAMAIGIMLLMTYVMYKFIVAFINTVGVESSVMILLAVFSIIGLVGMIQGNK